MTKTIDTGTKITFLETGDKFNLTKVDGGFELRKIKLSKEVKAELYNFHEILVLIENKQIAIDGFEESDMSLAISILTNYIHDFVIGSLKQEIIGLNTNVEALTNERNQLLADIEELKNSNKELNTTLEALNEE